MLVVRYYISNLLAYPPVRFFEARACMCCDTASSCHLRALKGVNKSTISDPFIQPKGLDPLDKIYV